MGLCVSKKYKHRMGKKSLILAGTDGNLLKNKEVVVEQTKHEFLFGTSMNPTISHITGGLEGLEKEYAEEADQKFFDIFNFATLPFYWGWFEPEQGKTDTERLTKVSNWLISKGITLKGHPLCWHTECAPWLLDMSNADILSTQLQRINRDVTDFSGIIDMWDVINEVVIMPIYDKYDNAITRICKELGRIPLIRKVFSAAREANPDATLLLNDFETSESYDILIEGCLESGIKIDAIGIQAHMHKGYWGVEKTQEILERFSRFNLPLHFTENTIVSGHNVPQEIGDLVDYQIDDWPSTPEGEELQALQTKIHYETLFAHPMVESITWWNFLDGSWLNAPCGFLRKDSSTKPVYDEIYKLIKDEWWTKPTRLYTDNNGSVDVEGFLGQYDIKIGDKKVGFSIDKENQNETLTI